MRKSNIINALIITNVFAIFIGGLFYIKQKELGMMFDNLGLAYQEKEEAYEVMSIAFDKNLKLYQNDNNNCIDPETYGYALNYAASLELGVRDIDAYSYIESAEMLDAREIAAETFNLRTYEVDVNPGEDQCYGLRHLDTMVCKDLKTNKCKQWIGGDFNTPDYNCDLFKLYKREAK